MPTSSFQEVALIETAFVFQPLQELNSRQKVVEFLDRLGYAVPEDEIDPGISLSITKFPQLVTGIQQLVQAPEDDKLEKIALLLPIIKEVVTEVMEIKNSMQNGFLSLKFFNEDPVKEFPKRLIDYLIFNYLFLRQPKIFGALFLMGVLDEEPLEANAYQRTGTVKSVKWDRLPNWFSKPRTVINSLYQWDNNFDATKFLERFQMFIQAMALPGGLYKQNDTVRIALGNSTNNLPELRIPIFTTGAYPATFAQFGLNVSTAEQIDANRKKGLALIPYFAGSAIADADINESWKVNIKSSLTLDAGAGVILRPPSIVETFQNIFTNPTEAGTLELFFSVLQKANAAGSTEEIYVFGDTENTRLTLSGISSTVFVKTNPNSQDVGIEGEVKEIKLVILPGKEDADAFIKMILPAGGIQASFGFGLGLSSLNGFYFKGASNIEILIPLHLQLGPVTIQNVLVAIALEDRKIPVEISTTIIGDLGPLQVVMGNIGIITTLTFPQNNDGNLGPINATLDFKPPNSVGLSINASIIKGGGFLDVDFEKGEYAGILELTVQNFLTLTAFGLVNTKRPDGTSSFSMLIIITAQFMPPFQLSYGFTLNGVGGLLGLDRMVLLDPLKDGVRTGAIDGIMFPANVVANAPRIINDLRAIFPPMEGSFLIGPMAKIGWGTPSLITLSLGIIVQLPDPKIGIIGILKMVLPTEELAILRMQVNFLGTIDPSEQLISFDASLFDSHLLHTMTLTGEMAVRLKWGDRPDFILSAGGFHPDYTPTMPVPQLARLGIKILDLENARIAAQCYFALTSNTVQLGVRADCYFGLDGFRVSGDLGFDALLQFSPFTFKATAGGGFELDTWLGYASVRISATLKGPTPWYVKAVGKAQVCGVEFEVPFEKTWGDRNSDTLPSIAIKQAFIDALLKDESWHSELPEGKVQLVALTSPITKDTDPPIRIEPFSILVISQKYAPLDLYLEQMGNKEISDHHLISMQSVTLGVDTAPQETIQDVFAAAQFKNLNDAEKLSRPSFEKFNSGVKARYASGNLNFKHGEAVRREHNYEQIIIDREITKLQAPRKFSNVVFKDLLKHNAMAMSKLSNAHYSDLGKTLPGKTPKLATANFAIVNVQDNQLLPGQMSFANQTLAAEALGNMVRVNPALADQITIQANY